MLLESAFEPAIRTCGYVGAGSSTCTHGTVQCGLIDVPMSCSVTWERQAVSSQSRLCPRVRWGFNASSPLLPTRNIHLNWPDSQPSLAEIQVQHASNARAADSRTHLRCVWISLHVTGCSGFPSKQWPHQVSPYPSHLLHPRPGSGRRKAQPVGSYLGPVFILFASIVLSFHLASDRDQASVY